MINAELTLDTNYSIPRSLSYTRTASAPTNEKILALASDFHPSASETPYGSKQHTLAKKLRTH